MKPINEQEWYCRIYGTIYGAWSRLIHRFNWHHTRTFGPLEDGAMVTRCGWCGLERLDRPWPKAIQWDKLGAAAPQAEPPRKEKL